MSDYKPGKMDISVQTETFGGFIKGIINEIKISIRLPY